MTTRIEKLKALRDLHDAWFEENEAKFADRFHPNDYPSEGSEYNQHNIDMDADAQAYDDFARRAAEIFGAQGSLAARLWNESDHPRDPGGEDGGKFIEKGTVGIDEGVAKKVSGSSSSSYRNRMSSLRRTLSGTPEEDEELSGGDTNAGRTYKVKWSDGTWTVGKNSRDIADGARSKKDQDDAEVLGAEVAAALDVNAPATMRNPSDKDWVYQEFMPGKTAVTKFLDDAEADRKARRQQKSLDDFGGDMYEYLNQRPLAYGRTEAGIKMGLLDQLIDNNDRNESNWLIDDDGQITAIDHGFSQGWKEDPQFGAVNPFVRSPFAMNFVNNNSASEEFGMWVDNALTQNDIAEVRQRLGRLKSQFDDHGRGEWFDNMMKRLDAIGKHAKGKQDVFGSEDDGEEAPQGRSFEETSWKTVSEGDFSGLKRVEGGRGHNPGGVYQAADGTKFYIKQHKSEENAASEKAAIDLYRAAAVDVPHVHKGTGAPGLKGPQIASEWRELEDADYEDPELRKRIQEDFAVDAWLANWDVAGAGGTNNIEVETFGGEGSGFPVRVEAGGALLTQGTGRPKGDKFTDHVGELDTMRDPRVNPTAASLFRDIGDEELAKSIERLGRVKPPTIRKTISDAGLPDEVAEKLIKRREYLLNRAEQLRLDLEAKNSPRAPGEPLRGRAALASTRLRLPTYEFDADAETKSDSDAMLYDRSGADIGVSPETVAEWSRILRGFRTGTFRQIGDYMRHPNEADSHFPVHPNDPNWPSNESIAMHVAYLTDAFDKSPLDDDLETYRGVWNGDDVFGPNWRPDSSMVGAKWVERGPTSTSPNPGIARNFGNLIFRIKAPKGTGAIQLSDWPLPDGSSTREAEIALQPDLRYRIVGDSVDKVDFNGSKARIFDIEVEPLGDDEEE